MATTTILIVDDDKFTRTVLETIFQSDGSFANHQIRILTASNGEEGLETYRDDNPDIVVIDLLMPKMDGFALAKAIRAEPSGEGVDLVVMSGIYRETAIANRVRSEYGAEFFAKPHQLKDMAQHVAKLLRRDGDVEVMVEDVEIEIASNGQLGQRQLPAVLLDMLDARATGRLTVRRGRLVKHIDLSFGHPIGITSNAREETLGHFLVNTNVISEQQHADAVKLAAADKLRLGKALIMLGALTPEQLVEQLTAQLRHKLVQSLRWPDGRWELEHLERRPQGTGGNAVELLPLVLQGLLESTTLDTAPHLQRTSGRPLTLNARGKKLVRSLVTVCPTLDTTWRDGATAQEQIDAGLEPQPFYAALDVLLLCGGIDVGDAPEDTQSRAAPVDYGRDISVAALSEHTHSPQLARPQTDDSLYSSLFDEPTMTPVGADPLEVNEDAIPQPGEAPDSGFIDVRSINLSVAKKAGDEDNEQESSSAKRMLLAEYLRIQGRDHYEVLAVEKRTEPAMISAAVVEKRSKFSMDWFSRYDLGRDYAKLEELHAAYDRAFEVLLDDELRRAYDRELAGGDLVESGPALEAEIDFRMAEELLRKGELPVAIRKLESAVENAPNEADYHAALGWALFLQGDRNERAADAARPHLNQALAINPDHAVAHMHKGVVTAELGNDDVEATSHLERALDGECALLPALDALEKVWRRRGEMRPLERQYRKLIYRSGGRDPKIEVELWVRLGALYRSDLGDAPSALVAYKTAARLAPDDSGIHGTLAALDGGAPDRFHERSEMLREHWKRDPTSPGPGLELIRAANQAGRHDAAFVAASALIARATDDAEAEALYNRYRPRFLIRAQRQLDTEAWSRIRHPDDSSSIGTLFALMTPAIEAIAPLSLDDLEVDETLRVDEADLPDAFVKVRGYVAHMLGVPVPAVYVRTDFGHQIHVGAVVPAILLAGDDALAKPERSELSFRLGRAMTYLWPGRTVGGARPGNFLKEAMLAAFSLAAPDAPIDDEHGIVSAIRDALETLDEQTQLEIRSRVAALTQDSQSINLSKWSRALARTADRVGLLLCGDLPAAVRFARDTAHEGMLEELVEFAVSSSHLSVRAHLGLSIDV